MADNVTHQIEKADKKNRGRDVDDKLIRVKVGELKPIILKRGTNVLPPHTLEHRRLLELGINQMCKLSFEKNVTSL